MKKLNILVVGAGMYVCGRQANGYGTIVPALLEWKKSSRLGEVHIAGNSVRGVAEARAKIDALEANMGIGCVTKYFPQSADNPVAYKDAMRAIPKPACAIIVVPDNLHCKIVGDCVKNGLHTLVVKPLVKTVKELRYLLKLQNKKDVYCAVEFHKRLDDANRALKDVIEKGAIGDPLYFLAEFSQRKSMPAKIFKKWAEQTNIFQYLGIHYVDIVYFATKAAPLRAMAVGQKNWLASQGIDTYDSIEATIEWQMPSSGKFVSCILTNWVDPESTSAMSDQRIKAIGTKGRFESDQKRRGITIVTDSGGIEEPNPYFCSPYGVTGDTEYRGYGIDSICQFLDDVVDIESGKIGPEELNGKRPTFEQSLIPTAVLEAVNESLVCNGKWIRIDIQR